MFPVLPRTGVISRNLFDLLECLAVCCVTDFSARNKTVTANLLQQGYRYHISKHADFSD